MTKTKGHPTKKMMSGLFLNVDNMAIKFIPVNKPMYSTAGSFETGLRVPYSKYYTQGVTSDIVSSILTAYQFLPHLEVIAAVRGTYELIPDNEGVNNHRRLFIEDENGDDFLIHLTNKDNVLTFDEFKQKHPHFIAEFSKHEFADMGLIPWSEIGLNPLKDATRDGRLCGNFVLCNALKYVEANK